MGGDCSTVLLFSEKKKMGACMELAEVCRGLKHSGSACLVIR